MGLRLGPASAFAGRSRAAIMRIYYDDATAPAVGEAPSAICSAASPLAQQRALLLEPRMTRRTCTSPCRTTAMSASTSSLDSGQSPIPMFLDVATSARRRQSDEDASMHVRRTPWWANPFTFLHTSGRGHVVGLALQAQGFGVEGTEYFEGDDRAVVDGDTLIHGTGSEDSFNGGWYAVPGRWDRAFSLPLSGSLGYSLSLSRTGGYRLYLGDAYAYRQSMDFTIEHGTDPKNSIRTDYAAVTYFYSEQPPAWGATSLVPAARRVVDVDHIVLDPAWMARLDGFSIRYATLAKRFEKETGPVPGPGGR
ncbi:MAG: DUF2961 domain-containing protein [Gemmatimonadaceae bacterium]